MDKKSPRKSSSSPWTCFGLNFMVVIILTRTSEENKGLAHLEKSKGKPPVVDLVVD